jgi:DNA-binding GntR family transcriptional regulator
MPGRASDMVDELEAIAAAIEISDARKARRATERHVEKARRATQRAFKASLEDTAE